MIAQAIFVKPTADGVAAPQAETPTAPLDAPLATPSLEQAPQENAPPAPEVAPLPTPADASQPGAVAPAPGF